MKIAEVKKLPPLERYLYFVRERDQILKKRRAGFPKPWTNDEILQTQYFTNVRREDDKVTIWFKDNIRGPLQDDPMVVFATIAFRWFNWIPTGEQLLKYPTNTPCGAFTDWNLQAVLSRLHGLKEHGAQIFTGAFNISNSGSTKPKIDRVCEDYIQPVWEQKDRLYTRIQDVNSMSQAFAILNNLPGLGGSGFMAGQVVCDLAYTHVLANAPDWHTWCSWGPGSKRGMNRVFGEHEDYAMPRAIWDRNLLYLMELTKKRLKLDLHARDVQNCLCEFGKYERGLEGTRLKRRYNGHA